MKVNKDVMNDLAVKGWTTASILADLIVTEKKLPFREAHNIVARLVNSAINQGKAPADVILPKWLTRHLKTLREKVVSG